MSNWDRTLALLGSDVIQCDASVAWDDSVTKGQRLMFRECRVGIADLKNQKYLSIDLDRYFIGEVFDSIGLHDDGSRKCNMVQMAELMAINLAAEQCPGFEIESDCQLAVMSAKLLMPNLRITWKPRCYLPLPHLIAKETPSGTGTFKFNEQTPSRGWIQFTHEI